MFDLIPISLLVTALGGVVYIVSNHLSEFEQNGEEAKPEFSFRTRFAGWVNQLPLDGAKAQSLSIAQKVLHKTRVLLLKTDNHLMELIGKISKEEKATEEKEQERRRRHEGHAPDIHSYNGKGRRRIGRRLPA